MTTEINLKGIIPFENEKQYINACKERKALEESLREEFKNTDSIKRRGEIEKEILQIEAKKPYLLLATFDLFEKVKSKIDYIKTKKIESYDKEWGIVYNEIGEILANHKLIKLLAENLLLRGDRECFIYADVKRPFGTSAWDYGIPEILLEDEEFNKKENRFVNIYDSGNKKITRDDIDFLLKCFHVACQYIFQLGVKQLNK